MSDKPISQAEADRRAKFGKVATTHGLSKVAEYWCWLAMRQRCQNPRHPCWPGYGGRGIAVCDQWNKFEQFIADMGRKPFPKATLERVDNDAGYFPENCVWTTQSNQIRNTRRTHKITLTGVTRCLKDWCRIIGRDYRLAQQRMHREGWTAEKALLEPVNRPPKGWKHECRS